MILEDGCNMMDLSR